MRKIFKRDGEATFTRRTTRISCQHLASALSGVCSSLRILSKRGQSKVEGYRWKNGKLGTLMVVRDRGG